MFCRSWNNLMVSSCWAEQFQIFLHLLSSVLLRGCISGLMNKSSACKTPAAHSCLGVRLPMKLSSTIPNQATTASDLCKKIRRLGDKISLQSGSAYFCTRGAFPRFQRVSAAAKPAANFFLTSTGYGKPLASTSTVSQ